MRKVLRILNGRVAFSVTHRVVVMDVETSWRLLGWSKDDDKRESKALPRKWNGTKVIQIEKHVGESTCLHCNLELRSYLTRRSCFDMQQLNKAQHNEKSI